MIISKIAVEKDDDGANVYRKIAIDGDPYSIARDLMAIAYALAKNVRERGLSKAKTNAFRIKFEQAFAAGFRITEEEFRDMDLAAIEELKKEIREEIETEDRGLMS
jgi:hypothetical protein